jgi:hypothetical protein
MMMMQVFLTNYWLTCVLVGDEPTVAKQAKIELIKDGLKREASQLSGTGDADTSTESVGADESTTASAPETIGTEKEVSRFD